MLSPLVWGNASELYDAYHAPEVEAVAVAATGRRRRRLMHPPVREFEDALHTVLQATDGAEPLVPSYVTLPCLSAPLDWDAVPEAVDPLRGGELPAKRALRKRQQLESMLRAIGCILRPGDRVVDFCSGSGHVGLLVAALHPQCHVTLVDMNEASLGIAARRVARMAASNVAIVHGLVQDFTGGFDLGVALHACGEATDFAILQCIRAQAAFVTCPCCVGKVQHSSLSYPRSAALRHALSASQFEALAKAADYALWDAKQFNTREHRRRACKSVVERDRAAAAEEAGYRTALMLMHPLSASPKNDIIVGWRADGPRRPSLPPPTPPPMWLAHSDIVDADGRAVAGR